MLLFAVVSWLLTQICACRAMALTAMSTQIDLAIILKSNAFCAAESLPHWEVELAGLKTVQG